MIDPVSVAIVAVAALGGWLIGRHGRLRADPTHEQPKPWCLCRHHYGNHDPATGACRYESDEERWSDEEGHHFATVSCSCVRYTGPQPVEQYWVPPAADMSIVTAPRRIDT